MQTLNDVHQQFAEYFNEPLLKPYLYTLSRMMSEGHTCIFTRRIARDQLPEAYQSMTTKEIQITGNLVGNAESMNKPFILDHDRFYLQRYYYYETQLICNIEKLIAQERNMTGEREKSLIALTPFIQKLFYREQAASTDWQLAAAITAVLGNFTMITGGPGTGKTTTVAKILAILFHMQPDMKVALAAPTGKAGSRMAESLLNTGIDVDAHIRNRFGGLKPATIHRLLGWQKGSPYFRHNASHPLPYDLVVVDESSMIDLAMFAKLLDALKPGSRIILLGDKDQLASVEAGSLFGDLCKALPALNVFDVQRQALINSFIAGEAGKIPFTADAGTGRHLLFQHLVELRYSHRFKNDEGIGRLSRAVIQNDTLTLQHFLDHPDDGQVSIDQQYDPLIFETFIAGYKAYIGTENIREAIDKFNNLRILCAVRQGDQGVHQMNAAVEAHLIKTGYLKRDSEYYRNRPVMVTQNDYTLGLYNGDTGIMREDENGVMKAWFIDTTEGNTSRLKSILPGFISRMETVFAMTIHKSQGSEFDKVMVVLPRNAEYRMLTRELLYTGITRAKHNVVIQSAAETLMASAAGIVERGSGVVERLQDIKVSPH